MNLFTMLIAFFQSLTDTFVSGFRVTVVDRNGQSGDYSGYGQQIVGERKDDILVKFAYSNSSEDIIPTVTGTGATSNANAKAVVSTGAGIGEAKIRSKRFAVYRPSHDLHSIGSFTFPDTNTDASTYQYGGLFKNEDAIAFGRSGTDFGILYRSFSSDTFIKQADWNKDKLDGTGVSGYTLNPSMMNQYRFKFGFLGISPIISQVHAGLSLGWITVHVIDQANKQEGVTFQNPSFPMAIVAGRTSGTGAVTVTTGSWAAGTTEGKHSHAGHRVFAGEAAKTIAAGVETYIATFENKSTYLGQTNTVHASAVFLSFTSDGTKSVRFRGYSSMTLSTSYNPVDVDTANSTMAVDTSSTSFTGGKFEFPEGLAKVDSQSLDVGSGHFHLELQPGERFTFTGESAGDNDVTLGARWEEFHS
jgi:hypothetical protein